MFRMVAALLRPLFIVGLVSAVARGQASPTVMIAVRVVDSADVPLADADVSIVRGISAVLAHASTNAVGRARLSVTRENGTLQLIVRKIGYQRAYRFFALPSADSMSVTLSLSRSVTTLAPVHVTAAEDLRRKSYHLDAEEIENSPRAMIDATDIFKLRPDMMTSRGGESACRVYFTDHDGWIENVWVNGRRVTLAAVDSQYVTERKPALGISSPPPRPNPRISRIRAPQPPPPAFTQFRHIDTVLSILRGIKPEHIAEITYHDCFDGSVGKNRSDMAMFIVLKPGIGYDQGRGSYVIADTSTRASGSDLDTLARYRFRLLGVFDSDSGDPLAGVDVIDSLTATSAKTTTSGTVSLFFLPEGASTVRLHRDGYRDTTFSVTISPADTVPITLVLRRSPLVPSAARSTRERRRGAIAATARAVGELCAPWCRKFAAGTPTHRDRR